MSEAQDTHDNDVLRTVADLCAFFGLSPEELPRLNRALYKSTDCGASISLYSGRPGVREPQAWRFRLEARADGGYARVRREDEAAWRDWVGVPPEVAGFFDVTDLATGAVGFEAEEWRALLADDTLKNIVWTAPLERGPDGALAREGLAEIEVLAGAVPGRAWHNGDDWSGLDPAVITGFTIQTIVEGSEVTVDSDRFEFPVPAAAVRDWLEEMEAQAAFYWKRDNGLWYAVTDTHGADLGLAVDVWGDLEVEAAEPWPEPLRVAIQAARAAGAHEEPVPELPGATTPKEAFTVRVGPDVYTLTRLEPDWVY